VDELTKQREQLDELKHLINSLNIFKERMPPLVFMVDLFSMRDEINYLSGYIDCMVNFGIELPPESL